MTTRKAPCDGNDKVPPKRQKVEEEAPSLDSINDDCLLVVMKGCDAVDLNSLACCGRRYQALRAHESLDQTREGIITISEGTSDDSLSIAIARNNWNEEFQGNRTKLKLVGVERFKAPSSTSTVYCKLYGVTGLQLECIDPQRFVKEKTIFCLSTLAPNLEALDLSNSMLSSSFPSAPMRNVFFSCPRLSKFTWNSCGGYYRPGALSLRGSEFNAANNLTELCVNDCCFSLLKSEQESFADPATDDGVDKFVLWWCHRLERLSIKNATYFIVGKSEETQPVSQAMLIKMVRCHSNLRWLRSDLSTENIALLRQERPDVTFVG